MFIVAANGCIWGGYTDFSGTIAFFALVNCVASPYTNLVAAEIPFVTIL